MILGLRGGHSPNCMGAIGLRNEYYAMQDFYSILVDVGEKYGHTIVNCNSNARSEVNELYEGALLANSYPIELFISLHMNTFNGQAHGTETIVYNENARALPYAENLCSNFEKLGFTNRGVKYNSNFYEMKNIEAPNIIFETCFCDSETDIEIWSRTTWEQLAYAFWNALDSNIPFTPPSEEQEFTEVTEDKTTFYRVVVGSFTKRENALERMEELKILGYKDTFLLAYNP